ncbi:MAG: hypothetical protein QOD71_2802 [Thermoleophilaceae bacterium]|jgi:hypothetical protein|nr:hypothetical protein [Thermoleophilaceae bacterium]
MWKPIAACLGLAGASLVLPSEPSYDPLAWLIWGRELAHLHLDTNGGPSWKPLPVALTTLFAPLGEVDRGLPPELWMVVARAGALLALALAFRLARRLAGGGPAGLLGGAVAAVALFLTPDWFQFSAHGSEAPIAVALMLWAIERHLDGRTGHTVVLGTLACLLRPELFGFLGLYGLWAWRAEPRLRPLVAGALLLLPLAWIGPEWIGSGSPLDGGAQARSQPAWSLSLAERPWLRALERVHNHAGLPLELLALVAVAVAFARRQRAVLGLAAAALAEVVLFAGMTQAGFSGNPRYVLPALAVGSVLAGVGAARLAEVLPALAPARTGPWRLAGATAALAVLAIAGQGFLAARVTRLEGEAREVGARMQLHRDVAQAVREAGGARAVRAFGSATSNRALQTRLAWELGVPMELVESLTAHRVVFRSSRVPIAGGVYMRGRAKFRQTLARVGSIRVYRREQISFPLAEREWNTIRSPFTGPLQGIHTRVSRGRIPGPRVVTR